MPASESVLPVGSVWIVLSATISQSNQSFSFLVLVLFLSIRRTRTITRKRKIRICDRLVAAPAVG